METTLRSIKKVSASEFSILEGDNIVGSIKKTADKSGHRCYGVFFDGKKQMLFSTLDTAKAVAERIQDSDFQ
jgi:hypothetical protein